MSVSRGGRMPSVGRGRGGTLEQQIRGSRDLNPDVALSKKLAHTLRHNAAKEGFKLRPDGYIMVSELLAHNKFKGYTLDDIRRVTDNNEKKRFAITEEGGSLWIRANQGHSLSVEELDLLPITDPSQAPEVIHGTYRRFWPSIQKEGLSRMKRNHIHFAPGMPGKDGVISGMRKSCEVFVFIDIAKALKGGIKFYRSANNVILTDGIDGGPLAMSVVVGSALAEATRSNSALPSAALSET